MYIFFAIPLVGSLFSSHLLARYHNIGLRTLLRYRANKLGWDGMGPDAGLTAGARSRNEAVSLSPLQQPAAFIFIFLLVIDVINIAGMEEGQTAKPLVS